MLQKMMLGIAVSAWRHLKFVEKNSEENWNLQEKSETNLLSNNVSVNDNLVTVNFVPKNLIITICCKIHYNLYPSLLV